MFPFYQRLSVFHSLVKADKQRYIESGAAALRRQDPLAMFLGEGGEWGNNSNVQIEVRRDRIIDDALQQLETASHRIKGRIQVQFVSEQGYTEAGIDGGGLFKEFMDTLCHAGFGVGKTTIIYRRRCFFCIYYHTKCYLFIYMCVYVFD